MKASVMDYANYIFFEKKEKNIIRLQKLLYFLYKESLQKNDEPLFKAKFQAWQRGPVNHETYKYFKKIIMENLDEDFDDDFDVKKVNKQVVDDMINKTSSFTTMELVNLSHDFAWENARGNAKDDDIVRTNLNEDDIKKSQKLVFE